MPQDVEQPGTVPKISIRDFPGLMTNADPRDLPLGASIHQVNVAAAYPGEIRARQGCRVLKFDQ